MSTFLSIHPVLHFSDLGVKRYVTDFFALSGMYSSMPPAFMRIFDPDPTSSLFSSSLVFSLISITVGVRPTISIC